MSNVLKAKAAVAKGCPTQRSEHLTAGMWIHSSDVTLFLHRVVGLDVLLKAMCVKPPEFVVTDPMRHLARKSFGVPAKSILRGSERMVCWFPGLQQQRSQRPTGS